MENTIKLLISPQNLQEAKITVASNVDYIDCKNPKEGSLGANFPWIIKSMKNLIPSGSSQLLSATIGDFPHLPGSASLAALGAAVSGADIIKVGLMGSKNEKEGIDLMEKVVRTIKEYNDKILVVAAGYADKIRMTSSPDFLSIPTIAAESGADIAMLDTFFKDGTGLFDYLNSRQLTEFIKKSHHHHLKAALAGNLRIEDLKIIKQLSPDLIGVRSVVCEGFDRSHGTIKAELINNLKQELYM